MVTRLSDTVVDTVAEGQFQHQPALSSGLNFRISGGWFQESLIQIPFQDSTFTLADDTVNYIVFNLVNNPATLEAVSGGSVPDNVIMLYQVVTSGGSISSVRDFRWKVLNNRLLTFISLPAEPEWLMVANSGAQTTYKNTLYIVRGEPGTPFFRILCTSREGGETLAGAGGTFGEWASGTAQVISPDGQRVIGNFNINGSSPNPFKVLTRAPNNSYDFTFNSFADVDPIENGAGTPVNGQQHGLRYLPDGRVLVSSNQGTLFYLDNQDGTYSFVAHQDNSFTGSTPSAPSDSRVDKKMVVDSSGNIWVASSSTIECWQYNSPANYTLINYTSGAGGLNFTPVTALELSPEESYLYAYTTIDSDINIYPFAINGITLTQPDSSLVTQNPTWLGTGANQINTRIEHVFVDEAGTTMIVTARLGTDGEGHFIFTGSNGTWTLSSNKLPNVPVTNTGQKTFYQFPGTPYFLYQVGNTGISNSSDTVALFRIDSPGNVSFVQWLPQNEYVDQRISGQRYEFSVYKQPNGRINPIDPIYIPDSPLFYFQPEFESGMIGAVTGSLLVEQSQDDQNITHFGEALSFQSGGTFRAAGPKPNSFAWENTSGTDYWFTTTGDPGDILEVVNPYDQGTVSILFRTPAVFPVNPNHNMVPILHYGIQNTASQPTIQFGFADDGAGNGRLAWTFRTTSSGPSNYAVEIGNTNLVANTWYIAHFVQPNDGTGVRMYLNGSLQTKTTKAGTLTITDSWFSDVTATKQWQLGVNTATGTSAPGTRTAAVVAYRGVFNPAQINNQVSKADL